MSNTLTKNIVKNDRMTLKSDNIQTESGSSLMKSKRPPPELNCVKILPPLKEKKRGQQAKPAKKANAVLQEKLQIEEKREIKVLSAKTVMDVPRKGMLLTADTEMGKQKKHDEMEAPARNFIKDEPHKRRESRLSREMDKNEKNTQMSMLTGNLGNDEEHSEMIMATDETDMPSDKMEKERERKERMMLLAKKVFEEEKHSVITMLADKLSLEEKRCEMMSAGDIEKEKECRDRMMTMANKMFVEYKRPSDPIVRPRSFRKDDNKRKDVVMVAEKMGNQEKANVSIVPTEKFGNNIELKVPTEVVKDDKPSDVEKLIQTLSEDVKHSEHLNTTKDAIRRRELSVARQVENKSLDEKRSELMLAKKMRKDERRKKKELRLSGELAKDTMKDNKKTPVKTMPEKKFGKDERRKEMLRVAKRMGDEKLKESVLLDKKIAMDNLKPPMKSKADEPGEMLVMPANMNGEDYATSSEMVFTAEQSTNDNKDKETTVEDDKYNEVVVIMPVEELAVEEKPTQKLLPAKETTKVEKRKIMQMAEKLDTSDIERKEMLMKARELGNKYSMKNKIPKISKEERLAGKNWEFHKNAFEAYQYSLGKRFGTKS